MTFSHPPPKKLQAPHVGEGPGLRLRHCSQLTLHALRGCACQCGSVASTQHNGSVPGKCLWKQGWWQEGRLASGPPGGMAFRRQPVERGHRWSFPSLPQDRTGTSPLKHLWAPFSSFPRLLRQKQAHPYRNHCCLSSPLWLSPRVGTAQPAVWVRTAPGELPGVHRALQVLSHGATGGEEAAVTSSLCLGPYRMQQIPTQTTRSHLREF